MNETQERLDEFEEWDKEQMETSRYFKPVPNEKYDIVLSGFRFGKKAFKPGDPEKWTMSIEIMAVNGKATEMEWNTCSGTIIRALRPFKGRFAELQKVVWRVRKLEEKNKTTYIFEDIGRVPGSKPATHSTDCYV